LSYYTLLLCFCSVSSSGVFVCILERPLECPFCEFEALGVFWRCIIELVWKVEAFFGGGGFGWGLRRPWLREKDENFVEFQGKPLPAATHGGTGGVRGRSRRFRCSSRLVRLSLPLRGQALSLPFRTLTSCGLF